MSRLPIRYLALVTRNQLAEMLAKTYAKLKDIDANDAYRRLEVALRDLELIEGLQGATWEALHEKKAGVEDAAMVELVAKKLTKPRRFKPASWRANDEGAWLALGVLIDRGAGVSSGEALDLLESSGGQVLLKKGLRLAGQHLAAELLR